MIKIIQDHTAMILWAIIRAVNDTLLKGPILSVKKLRLDQEPTSDNP